MDFQNICDKRALWPFRGQLWNIVNCREINWSPITFYILVNSDSKESALREVGVQFDERLWEPLLLAFCDRHSCNLWSRRPSWPINPHLSRPLTLAKQHRKYFCLNVSPPTHKSTISLQSNNHSFQCTSWCRNGCWIGFWIRCRMGWQIGRRIKCRIGCQSECRIGYRIGCQIWCRIG